MTDIDHTGEDTDAAVESTSGPSELSSVALLDDDDAGAATVSEESASESGSPPTEPAAPERARRAPGKPAAKGSTPRGARLAASSGPDAAKVDWTTSRSLAKAEPGSIRRS